jgi:hypothetical protein
VVRVEKDHCFPQRSTWKAEAFREKDGSSDACSSEVLLEECFLERAILGKVDLNV